MLEFYWHLRMRGVTEKIVISPEKKGKKKLGDG